ncbi:MAG: methionyl-tRNA formyltransferase [Candidatus Peregrinibacteria bacterium]
MANPLSIVFCGTPAFAIPSLKALAADPAFKIELVITQPDKPVGRHQILTPPPVKLAAQELHLPLIQPENINDQATSQMLKATSCNFLVVVAYGQLLKQAILDLPTIAPVNVHASLLPRWRGASPIQHALLAGDAVTGVTIQNMVRELDAGSVLAQSRITIAARETAQTLSGRLAIEGARLLVETLKAPLHPQEQDKSKITVCRKLSRKDGEVNPETMTAEEIDRRVRALTPWPGVTCVINGTTVKLLTTALMETPASYPLPCAKGTTLFITRLQTAGKKPVTGAEWMRGHAKRG